MSHRRIVEFLAQGMTPAQVVSIVGCQPAYFNSLMKDESFRKEVEEAAKPYLEQANEEEVLSNKHLSLEHKILNKIEGLLAGAEMKDVTRALEVVGNRQDKIANRKVGFNPNLSSVNVVHVSLNLPAHAIPEYTLSNTSEVTTIGNTAMNPLPSASVRELFKHRAEMKLNAPLQELASA